MLFDSGPLKVAVGSSSIKQTGYLQNVVCLLNLEVQLRVVNTQYVGFFQKIHIVFFY